MIIEDVICGTQRKCTLIWNGQRSQKYYFDYDTEDPGLFLIHFRNSAREWRRATSRQGTPEHANFPAACREYLFVCRALKALQNGDDCRIERSYDQKAIERELYRLSTGAGLR